MALPISAFDWRGSLERAQARAGLKDDTVAHLMGITRQRWAQMRDQSANLSLQHLSALSSDVDGRVMLEAFFSEWSAFHGFTRLDVVWQWLREANERYEKLQTGMARMAKAQLPEREERKRA